MKKVSVIGLWLLLNLINIPMGWAKENPASAKARYQQEVLDEVNRYRLSRKLPPLKLNAYMSMEAEKHSQDMASKRMSFGHQDFNIRIKHVYDHVQWCRAGSENIAYYKISPREVVRKWLTSPGHRRNIEGRYNLTGIGVAWDDKGWVYYTQLFVRTDNPKYA